jgi:hypothetical protein
MTVGLAVYLTMCLAVPLAICAGWLLWLLALLSMLMLASEMAALVLVLPSVEDGVGVQ